MAGRSLHVPPARGVPRYAGPGGSGLEREALTVGVLGLGQIGRTLLTSIGSGRVAGLHVTAAFSRTVPVDVRRLASTWRLCRSLPDFLQHSYAVLVECASHEAVREAVPQALQCGHDVVIASSGALSDDSLRTHIVSLARQHGRQVYLAAGALGSLEILSVLREEGIRAVRLTTRKPPGSVPGYEEVRGRAELFSGTAREASAAFPRNLNIAATLGLLGIGLDRTLVTLRVEPDLTRTRHEIDIDAARGRYHTSFEVEPAAGNPQKTAVTADNILWLLQSIQGASPARLLEIAGRP